MIITIPAETHRQPRAYRVIPSVQHPVMDGGLVQGLTELNGG
jgi:hypothetical protein